MAETTVATPVPTTAATPTEAEAKALAELKRRLSEAGISVDYELHDDTNLLRFIRARDDVGKSFEMFKKSLEWREKMKVDGLYDRKFPNLIPLRSYWPGNFHKLDRDGVPVYIERIALLDIKGVFKAVPDDELILFHIWCMEENLTLKKKWSKKIGPVHGNIVIEDLKGLSFAFTDSIGLLKKLAQIDDNNYPENLKRMYIINSPTIFTAIWKAVKPFLNENTIRKVRILGSDHKSLQEDIAPENIPVEYGGTCRCEGGCCVGGGPYVHVPPTADSKLVIHHRLPADYL